MEEENNGELAVENKKQQVVKQYDETTPQYDEVQVAKKVERTDSFFDGKLLELIGYGILRYLITVCTLGLASAWGEKLVIAYKIEHTVYNGKRLKFEGTGASLFIQKFKWIFFSIITLGIYSLWIPIKKEKWIIENTHYEKEEFVKGDSYFNGGLLGLIGVNLFCKIITIISLGILYPFGICYKQKWFAKHTVINRKKIVFNGTAMSLIGHYLLWWFLCIITFGIYGLWLPIKIEQWTVKNTHIKLKDEKEQNLSVIPAVVAIVLAVTLIVSIVAYIGTNADEIMNNSDFDLENIFDDFEKGVNEKSVKSQKNSYVIKPIVE